MTRSKLSVGIGVVALLAAWEGGSRALNIPAWILPPPSSVALAFTNSWDPLLGGLLQTTLQAFIGLCAAFVAAAAIVASAVRWPRLEPFITGLFAAGQSVPIIAIAPLLTLWFGNGIAAKSATAFLLCLAPLAVNWLAGIRSIDPEERQMFTVWRAGWSQRLWYLILPDSLPYLLAGLRIGAPLALIGAIVGEFVGARNGLGFIIMTSSYYARTALMFAAVFLCALIGLGSYAGIRALENRVLRWRLVREAEELGLP